MKRKLGKNQQLALNMAAAFVNFAVNAGISFFLQRYVINSLGTEANGFVALARNIVQYATIITVALNTIASRFITIKVYENDMEGANKYFNSVLASNVFIAAFLFVPMTVFTLFVDKFLTVPAELVTDLKLLFAFLFINCLIAIMCSAFGTATYVKNKLYLTSTVTIFTNLIRGILLLFLYRCFPPQIFYSGLVALLMTMIVVATNLRFTKQLLPELKVSRKYVRRSYTKELFSSGIWNIVLKLGFMLTDGIDLLVTNIFLNATSMGILSIAKTIPTQISNIISMISSVFAPNLNILYAKNQHEELKTDISRAIKLTGTIISIPLAILVIFGKEFFMLWLPNENASQLHLLSILTVAGLLIAASVDCLNNVFTITNRLKANAIVIFISGLLSAVTMIIVFKTTKLGIFAVPIISSTYTMLRNLFFTIPYSAICFNLKWYTFYKNIGKSILSFGVITGIGLILKSFITVNSWLTLIIGCGAFCIIAFALAYFIILNKKERELIRNKVFSKFTKRV